MRSHNDRATIAAKDVANAEVFGRAAADQAFAALVYVVVDNTLHVLAMLAGFAALLHWEVIG